jgi:hypothetical protein
MFPTIRERDHIFKRRRWRSESFWFEARIVGRDALRLLVEPHFELL